MPFALSLTFHCFEPCDLHRCNRNNDMTAHHLGLVSMLFSKRYFLSHVLLTPCRAPLLLLLGYPTPSPCPTQPNARSDNKPVSGSAV